MKKISINTLKKGIYQRSMKELMKNFATKLIEGI